MKYLLLGLVLLGTGCAQPHYSQSSMEQWCENFASTRIGDPTNPPSYEERRDAYDSCLRSTHKQGYW